MLKYIERMNTRDDVFKENRELFSLDFTLLNCTDDKLGPVEVVKHVDKVVVLDKSWADNDKCQFNWIVEQKVILLRVYD